jgi:hypothetical protein
MGNPRLFRAALALVIAAAAPAYADDSIFGTYEVTFEEVAHNCDHPLRYERGIVKIERKGDQVQVDIERTPLMRGAVREDPKVMAKSGVGHTSMAEMDGVFSVAGRVTSDGMLKLTLVGEYQRAGRPLCTQSWNLSGLRTDAKPTGEKSKPRH